MIRNRVSLICYGFTGSVVVCDFLCCAALCAKRSSVTIKSSQTHSTTIPAVRVTQTLTLPRFSFITSSYRAKQKTARIREYAFDGFQHARIISNHRCFRRVFLQFIRIVLKTERTALQFTTRSESSKSIWKSSLAGCGTCNIRDHQKITPAPPSTAVRHSRYSDTTTA